MGMRGEPLAIKGFKLKEPGLSLLLMNLGFGLSIPFESGKFRI